MALRRAIRCTPIDSTAVTTAGNPSGTAATANATPRIEHVEDAGHARGRLSTRMMVVIIDDRDHHDDDRQDLADAIELLLKWC